MAQLRKQMFDYASQGEWSNLIACTTQCIEMAPSANLFHTRGMAHQKLGNFYSAMVDFDMALTLSPSTQIIQTLRTKVDSCMKTLLVAYVQDFVEGKPELFLPPLPSTWATWSHNETFHQLQNELEEAIPLKRVAGDYDREFTPFPFWGCELDCAEIVAFIHFAVEGQGAHEGYPTGVPGGYAPNATIQQLFGKWAMISSTYFGVPLETANAFFHQKLVVFDALPIDGPARQADASNPNNPTYKKIRKKADKHSLKYCEAVFKLVKNVKLILLYSRETYDLITNNRHIIPEGVQILQASNVVHPCTLAPGFPYPQHEIAVENYVEAHIQVLSSYFGVSPDSFKITPGILNRMFEYNVIRYSKENYQLWDGEPGTPGAVMILQRKNKPCIMRKVPIDNYAISKLKLEVGEHKKIQHSSQLTNKNGELVDLYLKMLSKTPGNGDYHNGEDFMAENTFPLENPNNEGKRGKSKGGSDWSGNVALFFQAGESKNTDESALAVVVCNKRLACALMGVASDRLTNLEKLMVEGENLVTAAGGNKFVAETTKMQHNNDYPHFDKLPCTDRYVDEDVCTSNKMTHPMLRAVNAYHAEHSEWKKFDEIPDAFKKRFERERIS